MYADEQWSLINTSSKLLFEPVSFNNEENISVCSFKTLSLFCKTNLILANIFTVCGHTRKELG